MEEETTSEASAPKYVVKFAVYGGSSARQPNTYLTFAADVSTELRQYLNQGQVRLCICNGMPSPNPGLQSPYPPFPDTAPGYQKGFAAVVAVNGVDQYFACSEGQTIDFSVPPADVIHSNVLQLSNLTLKYVPARQSVFTYGGFTLTNTTGANFPRSNPSAWVSIDFYLTTSTSAVPTAANKIGDMALAVSPNPMPPGQTQSVSLSQQNLINISRMLQQNPAMGPPLGTTCYVFATMRQPDGTVRLNAGTFSGPFAYNGALPLTSAEV